MPDALTDEELNFLWPILDPARDADIARVDDRGQTALAAAVRRRSADSVRRLLAAGADPALGPISDLDVACFFERPEMRILLVDAQS